jgi:hypothetical protein
MDDLSRCAVAYRIPLFPLTFKIELSPRWTLHCFVIFKSLGKSGYERLTNIDGVTSGGVSRDCRFGRPVKEKFRPVRELIQIPDCSLLGRNLGELSAGDLP